MADTIDKWIPSCDAPQSNWRKNVRALATLGVATAVAISPFSVPASSFAQTAIPLFKRPYYTALYYPYSGQNIYPLPSPRVAGNRIARVITIYARTAYARVVMPIALITRVTRYKASITPSTLQESSNQPVYNQ